MKTKQEHNKKKKILNYVPISFLMSYSFKVVDVSERELL